VEAILREILHPLTEKIGEKVPSCFLLGCTHFPVLKKALREVLGPHTLIVDPARTVAQIVYSQLKNKNLLCEENAPHNGTTRFLATDGVERFARVARIFLEKDIFLDKIELICVPAFSQEENIFEKKVG
jgi:glutamate racemase